MASKRVAEILAGLGNGSTASADLPQRLVVACARAVPVTHAGLVLMTDAGPAGTLATTDGVAAAMEEHQFTLGEGPGVDCSGSGRPVLQPDLAATGPARWPAFTVEALDAGIRAVFALPLRVGGIRVGALDLYRDRDGALSQTGLADALHFADAATAIVLKLQADSTAPSGHSAIPTIENQAVVHQATGMISVHAQVTLAQAFVLLRARAYAAERPLAALATDVVSGVVRFTDDDGNPGQIGVRERPS